MSEKNLLQPVIAFSNGSEFMWWSENNCEGCKWYVPVEDEAPRFLCPLQRAIDNASISNGKISPWTMHVAGIQDGGMCKVKEVMKWL